MNKAVLVRLFDAWIRTLGIFGFIHSMLLLIGALRAGSTDLLNIATIFDLPLFFPEMNQNVPPFWITILFVVVVYVLVLKMSEKKLN